MNKLLIIFITLIIGVFANQHSKLSYPKNKHLDLAEQANIPNCELYFVIKQFGCLKCQQGYREYKNDKNGLNLCESCPKNCKTCGNTPEKCQVCFEGFESVDGICTPCPLNCKICTKGKCNFCIDNFYINQKSESCERCADENCLKCDSEQKGAKCITCLPSFYSKEGICVNCPENCQICDKNGFCKKCELDFEIQDGKCKKKEEDSPLSWKKKLLYVSVFLVFFVVLAGVFILFFMTVFYPKTMEKFSEPGNGREYSDLKEISNISFTDAPKEDEDENLK